MIYCTDVSFMPLDDRPKVKPPFKKGQRTNTWVKTSSKDPKEIEEAARRKMLKCYGLEIADVTVYDGSTFTI